MVLKLIAYMRHKNVNLKFLHDFMHALHPGRLHGGHARKTFLCYSYLVVYH